MTANNSWGRLNKKGGGVAIEEILDWHIIPHHDLAVAPVGIDFDKISASYIPDDMFVQPDTDIVHGDDVFMIGRFIHVDGKQSNSPSVRFGNVSLLETSVGHPEYGSQKSIVVELRSVCGYSGSPCFHSPAAMDLRSRTTQLSGKALKFLGVHWGHVTEHAPVEEKIVQVRTAELAPDEKLVQYVNSNTGMNGIVAAWHVRAMIEHFRPMMTELEENRLREIGTTTSGTMSDGQG